MVNFYNLRAHHTGDRVGRVNLWKLDKLKEDSKKYSYSDSKALFSFILLRNLNIINSPSVVLIMYW